MNSHIIWILRDRAGLKKLKRARLCGVSIIQAMPTNPALESEGLSLRGHNRALHSLACSQQVKKTHHTEPVTHQAQPGLIRSAVMTVI